MTSHLWPHPSQRLDIAKQQIKKRRPLCVVSDKSTVYSSQQQQLSGGGRGDDLQPCNANSISAETKLQCCDNMF